MKFDTEWREAITLLTPAQQSALADAIRLYQRTDTMPSELSPEQMVSFLFAKAVIDRRKRINARARQRRLERAAATAPAKPHAATASPQAAIPSAPSPAAIPSTPEPPSAIPEATVVARRPPRGPVSPDYYKAIPGYRRIYQLSYPGQQVSNDCRLIREWHRLMVDDEPFLRQLADLHHLTVDALKREIPAYDIYLMRSEEVSVDCLEDYELQFGRYMITMMLRQVRRRNRLGL